MKAFKLTFFLLAILSITACGDDEDEMMAVCSQADWVGVYTGNQDCTEEPGAEAVTLTITADGTDAVNFVYEYDDNTTISNVDPITIDNCGFRFSGSEQGITLTLEATLDGDKITFVETTTVGSESDACTIEATRN